MPDKKYHIQLGTTYDVWDSDRWEREGAKYMKDNPTAEVYEESAYDPADVAENDAVFINGMPVEKYVAQYTNPDSDKPYDWKADASTDKRRVRHVPYWKSMAEQQESAMKGMDPNSEQYATASAEYEKNPYVVKVREQEKIFNADAELYYGIRDLETQLADMDPSDERYASLAAERDEKSAQFAKSPYAQHIKDEVAKSEKEWERNRVLTDELTTRLAGVQQAYGQLNASDPEFKELKKEEKAILAQLEANPYYKAKQEHDVKYGKVGADALKANVDAAQKVVDDLVAEKEAKMKELTGVRGFFNVDRDHDRLMLDKEYGPKIALAKKELKEATDAYNAHPYAQELKEYKDSYLPNLRAQIQGWKDAEVDEDLAATEQVISEGAKWGEASALDRLALTKIYGDDKYLFGREALTEANQFDRALAYIDLAEEIRTKGDAGFGGGLGYWAEGMAGKLSSQSDLDTYAQLYGIYKRLEKELGNLDYTEEDLEAHLSHSEQALLLSYVEYLKARQEMGDDLSWWFKAGEMLGEAIPFMVEMFATGGFSGAADDAVKGLVKTKLDDVFGRWFGKAMEKKAGKIAFNFLSDALSGAAGTLTAAAIDTVLAPTTYSGIAESMIQIKEDGTLSDSVGDIVKATASQYGERLSEKMGQKAFGLGPFGRAFGDIMETYPKFATKLTGLPLVKFGKALVNNEFVQDVISLGEGAGKFMRKFGQDGVIAEIGEELWKACYDEVLGINMEAMEQFFDKDNFVPMALSFIALNGARPAVTVAELGYANSKKLYLGAKVDKTLRARLTDEQADYIMAQFEKAETPQEMYDAIKAVTLGLAQAGASQSEIDEVWSYAENEARYKTLVYAKAYNEGEVAQAKRQEIEADYGGRFWMLEEETPETAEAAAENEAEGEATEAKPEEKKPEKVQMAVLNNGQMVFVLAEADEAGDFPILDVNTKRKGKANLTDIKISKETGKPISRAWDMQHFLTMQVAKDTKAKDEQRMTEEKKANIAKVTESVMADPVLNLGTEAAPNYVRVQSTDENGVKAIDENGNEIDLTWEQVGNKRGIRVKPLTRLEIAEKEVEEYAKRQSERIKARGGASEISDAADFVANDAEAASEYIPKNPDGSVDEKSFWENDPEGWAKWNDKQNKDDGADTLQQIEAAKAEINALLAEARKGMKTSDPNMRKLAKAKAVELEERLARMEALEQKYSPEAQAEKRLQEWEKATGVKFTRLYTLADVAAVDSRALTEATTGGLRAFMSNGKPYIYMPGLAQGKVQGAAEADEIFVHEAVAHSGLKGLLGQRAFDELCEQVWEMMSTDARRVFIAYPSVHGDHLAAADEYIAHVAEKMGANVANYSEKTIWEKIVAFIRKAFRAMGMNLKLTEAELSDLLQMAYADLAKNVQAESQRADAVIKAEQKLPAEVRQAIAMMEANKLTPEEQKATTANDVKAAQEAYDKLMKGAPTVEMGETTEEYIARKKAYNDQLDAAQKKLRHAQAVAEAVMEKHGEKKKEEVEKKNGKAVIGSDFRPSVVMTAEEVAAPRSLEPSIIGDENAPIAETDGNGSIRFSTLSYEQGGRDYLVNWLAKEKYMEQDEKDFIVATLDQQYAVAKELGKEFPVFGAWSSAEVNLDEDGNPVMSVIKNNGDYAMNLDFSLICKKRRPLNALLDVMIADRMLDMRQLDEQEIATINKVIQRHGFEVACALCFVDSKRYRVVKVAKGFADMYNELVESLIPAGSDIVAYESNYAGYEYINERNAQKTGRDLSTVPASELNWEKVDEILKGVKRPKSVEQKIAWALRKNASQRRLVNATDFVTNLGFESVKKNNPELLKIYNSKKGTGGPKASFGDVQYLNDILKSGKFTADKAAQVGGVRIQSFSDYMGHMFFDYMQMVAELSAKGLTAHAYTKEEAFARIFGMTGIKINMSLVPAVAKDGVAAGLDAEGNYVWAVPYTDEQGNEIQGQTFPPEVAFELQKDPRYSGNLGVIAVGVSDAHILKMLNDENIHFVIPYHKSSLNPIVAKMTGIDQYEDYTDVQNERLVDKPQYANLESKQKTNIIKKRKFDFYGSLARTNDPKATAKEYLEHCRKNDLVPKYEAFSKHENYYKLLADFNLYDFVTGEYAPQAPVKMNFPEELNDLVRASVGHNEQLESDLKDKVGKMAEDVKAELGELRYSFIGEKGAAALDKFYAATTRIDNLAIAREMESKGNDAKAIKYATGWERGADGKWRYEIGDYNFRLADDWRKAKTLGDAIEHDELFAAYPELKEIVVDFDDNANSNGGNFNPKENKITVRATNEFNIGHSLIHEIQHAIQHKEGFARGASVFEMAKRSGNDTFMLSQQRMNEMKEAQFIAMSMDDNVSMEDLNEMRKNVEDDEERRIISDIMSMMGDGATIQQVRTQYAHEYSKALRALQREVEAPDSPYNQYLKVMGEVESRNTSRRKFYSEVKRRSTLASETEDIAREDQIFLGEALDAILPTASENLRFSVNPEVRAEMDGILANAMVDGLFERDENGEVHMLAPNGKRSNLDMDKWALVRTANFKQWFGDWENDPENASKVVDENGEPKVVYHQTNASVYINRETGQNWDELGWKEKMEWDERDDWDEYWEEQEFNTFSRVNARTTNEFDGFFFAPEYDEYHEYGERTIPAFLNIKNPASREDYNIDSSKNDAGKDERIRLQNEGFDGVIRMEGDEVDEYIAFEPNQIKSIHNNGEFSESGDIRFSVSDVEKKRAALQDTEPVSVAENTILASDGESGRKAAMKWYDENIGKELSYNTEIGNVTINRRSIKNSLAHGYSQTKLDAIASLPDGFERAVYITSEPDYDGKPEDNHYFVYPITYKGGIQYVFCRAKSDVNKTSLYIHEVFPIDAIKGHTLQTAAGQSQPHRGMSLYLDLLKEVLYGKGTNNFDTASESGEKVDASAITQSEVEAGTLRASVVIDPALIEKLDNEEYIVLYRAMQIHDGGLYQPMAGKVSYKKGEKAEWGDPIPEKTWLQSDETPWNAVHARYDKDTKNHKKGDLKYDKDGNPVWVFKLDKGNGKSLYANYNPYIHTSFSPLNDQFSEAQDRDNLVVVRVLVPKSELTSGYKAEKAHDAVGTMPWHSGPISGVLAQYEGKERVVMLTRYAKIDGIVEWSEVADEAMKLFEGTELLNNPLPTNVFMKGLREELERRGVEFVKTSNGGEILEGEHKGKTWSSVYGKDALGKKPKDSTTPKKGSDIRFSTAPSSIDIEAVKGLQLFESMGYDLEGQMKLAEDSVAAALKRIKYWSNSKKVGAEQGRAGAQHAFEVAKRQMELLRDVQSQLIDVTYMEPAPREGDEPQNIREYIAQMLTGKNGSRLTPETLENELGWSAADRAGMKYIVSSKGMSVNELAELIMADAPAHVLRGMESDDVRNEILDFLQSVRTYAEIRDYMANARMAEAKAEADQYNADIDRFKEEFEAREGMTVEQYNEMVIQQMKEARDAWLASAENPAAFTPEEENDVTDVPSDEELEGMTVEQIVNSGKQKMLEAAAEAKDSFMERVFKINARLDKVRAALAAQREYDQTTAALIADMANEMLENGALSKVTRAEIKRIVSAVKNAVGKQDITPYVDRIMDVMIGNQIRNAKNRLKEFLKIKGKKVNSSGVEVQGKLDIEGQGVLAAMKKGMAYDMAKLESEIAEAEDRLFDSSQVISRDAANELAGLYMAQEHMENIKASEAEEVSLRDELDKAQKERRAGRMSREAFREYEKSIVDAVRENRMQRVTAYENLLDNMAERVMSSIAKANALREADKARVERIHHFANSDMQGMPADELKQTPKGEAFWNNSIVQFFLSPLATFDQMLRHFASKSRDGKGYLWNHFMGGWMKAAENEYTGVRDAHSVLDEKARQVFGKDVKRWSDIFSIVKRLPNMKFEVFDAGKMKEYEFTQGNLMYIYMVNKMSDGKMKLRRMGITEEQVEQIAREMDPRLVELADWLQDSFLPSLREKYNTVHERMFGAPMAAIENYFPLVVNQNARAREEDVNNPQGAAKPSTITGAIIKRTKNSAALDLLNADALDVVLGHIEDMEHWAAFAEWNRDLNTLLSYKTFRNRLQNASGIYGAGKELWKNFRTAAEIAAGVYQPAGKGVHDKLALNLAKGVTGAKISFRVYTALKQFLSMPAFISDSRPDILMKNMANPMGAWNWAMENLPLFEKRWKSRQAGDSRLMATESDWKMWQSKAVEIAGRVGMTPNAFVDAVTVSIGARSIYETKYRQYLDYGYSEEQAREKAKLDAQVLFNESQQSNEAAFLSQMQVDRTWWTSLLTVFRNSSMGYQRMYVDSLRNLGRMMKKGYKEESIEYMKKQMVRDGLTEEQAQRAAEKIYRRSFTKNATQAFTFGFLVQFAWNLGPVAVYLLMGDDDDEKWAMLKDAAVRGVVGGPVEGLAAGQLASSLIGNAVMGEKISETDGIQLPAISDLETLKTLWDTERYRALNDLFNIVVQSGIGVNPQTFTDVITAVVDACNGDMETSKEVMFAVMRILQVPQSQIGNLYMDEIDLTADEAYDMTVQEFAERYAKYKMMRNAPLTKGLYPEEDAKAREEKYIMRFLQDMREKRKARGSEEAQLWLEYIDTEFKEMGETLRDLKKAVEKAEEGSAEQKAAEDALEAAYESPEYEKYGQAKAVKSLYDYRKEEPEDPYADAELKAAWNELMDMFNAPELKR